MKRKNVAEQPPKKHGGARPNSGPMPKSAAGVRRMFSFRVDPENLDFLRSLPRGTVADFLNDLIKQAR